ncbi:MAG: tyrosine-type recombinase/integrase [Bacteroidia bacterium]
MEYKTFKNYLISQGKSKSTVSHYQTYVLDFISFLDADNTEAEQASSKEILAYMNHLQLKGQGNSTRNIRLNVIRQFMSYQMETGQRIDNPAKHLKIRGSHEVKLYPLLDKQELESIYTNYQVPTEKDERIKRNWFKNYRLSKTRNKAILSLMLNQALTTPEVEKLEMNDLQLKEGTIRIKGSRRSNERTLELKPNQIIELMEYQFTTRAELLKYQGTETKKLFLSVPTAGKEKANATLQIWKGLTKEIKSTNKGFINFKQVRTSVITHWLKQFNLRQVQYMAGHKHVSSTERYLVNQTEDLQKDIDQFYPF